MLYSHPRIFYLNDVHLKCAHLLESVSLGYVVNKQDWQGELELPELLSIVPPFSLFTTSPKTVHSMRQQLI